MNVLQSKTGALNMMFKLLLLLIFVTVVVAIIYNYTGTINNFLDELNPTCAKFDYDNDSISNSDELNSDIPCPCDDNYDQTTWGYKLQKNLWTLQDNEGPYKLFDKNKEDELKKLQYLPAQDFTELVSYYGIASSGQETTKKPNFSPIIKGYMKSDPENLVGELTPEFFCPISCKGLKENDFDCCSFTKFKNEWFITQGADDEALVIVCQTNRDVCGLNVKNDCEAKIEAAEAGKVNA